MNEASKEIGNKIRTFRKKQKMTLDALAERIYKSKATVSKYEKGEISIDINTLYDIAAALDANIDQLLYMKRSHDRVLGDQKIPPFFRNLSQFYGYWYDGRNNSILRMVFDVMPSDGTNIQRVMMYMNFDDYKHYPICENTYSGTIEHYDALSIIQLTNQHLFLEKGTIQILAASLDFKYKWGMWTGLSSRPMMPVSTKMLVSRERLKEDEELVATLKISKEDIRLLKLYNMFTVL